MDVEGFWTEAVRDFWGIRNGAGEEQGELLAFAGRRGQVVGGKHTDGFLYAIRDLLIEECRLPPAAIRLSKPGPRSPSVLPGFFRPTKNWDMVVSHRGELLAVIELKSQVGPSFGNNVNNRAEEAIGNAQDLWVAFREGGYMTAVEPFVGYMFVLEDHPATKVPIALSEPLYEVFPEFKRSSYRDRYEILCERLVAERLYTSACLITTDPAHADRAQNYSEVSPAVSTDRFLEALIRRCMQF